MRDDQALDVGPLEPRRGTAGEPPHVHGGDVRAGQARHVLALDLGDGGEPGDVLKDVRPDSAGTAAPVAGSSRIEMVPPVKRMGTTGPPAGKRPRPRPAAPAGTT